MCDRQDSPVIIEDDRTGYRYPALLRAGKDCDLYLESNYARRPGSTLHLQFPLTLTASRAVIRWASGCADPIPPGPTLSASGLPTPNPFELSQLWGADE